MERGDNNDSSGGNGTVYQFLSGNVDKRADRRSEKRAGSSAYREDERTF